MKKHLLTWSLLFIACFGSFSQDLEKLNLKDLKKKLSPKEFLKKGINCDELMRNVTKEVYNQSKQVQVPWQKGSLINEFVF